LLVFSPHRLHTVHKINVVTVAGICNSVGGGVFFDMPVAVANIGPCQGCCRFKIVLVVLECANCSMHAMVGCTTWDHRDGLTKYSA